MTPAEIIATAREAGFSGMIDHPALQRFAAIIAAKQREKDAQIAENIDDMGEWGQAASVAAAAIRGQE